MKPETQSTRKRTTFTLPDDVLELLEKHKQETDAPMAATVARAVRAYLADNTLPAHADASKPKN
jgi:hypothetical protein